MKRAVLRRKTDDTPYQLVEGAAAMDWTDFEMCASTEAWRTGEDLWVDYDVTDDIWFTIIAFGLAEHPEVIEH